MCGDISSFDSRSDRRDHATWKNLSVSSLIELTRLNGNDSHPSVSCEPLIEDEESKSTAMPNLAYKYACSSMM